jgi:cyclomaltodextrinase
MRRFSPGALALLLLASAHGADSSQDWSKVQARETPAWVRDSVVYEVFPRQFSPTGNLAGVTARLGELKALGVDVIWLMPIHPIGKLKAKGSIGSPYAVQDYYAVNPDYGTKEDLARLVDTAHGMGMKVMIDIVANHTSWDSVMLAHPAYYKRDAAGSVISPHPDWADVAGLDYSNPETRQYMRAMLRYWVGTFHLDGLRCDAAGEIPTSFWEGVRDDMDKLRPGIFLLAEASKPELMAKAFDVDYAWPLMHSLNQVLMEGAPASELRRTWTEEEQDAFPAGTLHLLCSDNHDEARAVSRFGWNGALAASAMMFTLDGVPLLYNGMEVGDSSESGDPALFEKLPVFWHPRQREYFRDTYTQLIALRHKHAALRSGTLTWLGNSAPQNVVSFMRRGGGEELVTVVNFSNRPQPVVVHDANADDFAPVLAGGTKGGEQPASLPGTVLGAYGWVIYLRAIRP